MAVDIALAVLPIIADYTIVPIKREVCYALYCKTNLKDLEKEVGKLKASRDDLLPMVDEQRRNGKTIHKSVTKWLQEVEAMIGEMERQLEDDENRRKMKCFIGLCPYFITRYKLGKNAKKELATVANKLEQMPRFDSIAYHAAPVVMGSIIPNIKGYEAMGSRNKILNDIMNALKVVDGKMVGVYGMGGIGKTTLVKVVAREALEQQLFDKVAIATVTQNQDIMRIQQEIGDQLGITFKDKVGEWGRAYQLRDWLKEQKKILIVLDDLWTRLDLETVGISFQNEQKDCRLLLTSRDFDVLSMEMDVQNNFFVDVLEKEETWDLFKKTAGGNVEDPEVQPIALKIATRCGGLPVAVVSIAKALKDKCLSQWKDAWCELQKPSPGNFTRQVSGEVYRAIELSYQRLESVELKSTFLLCSRMGYNASIDDLLKYSMGLGFFSYVATTEEARNKVSSLVHELKKSCLLLDGNTSNQFSIHDVVHDVAISIAFRDHAVFVKGTDEVQMEGRGRDSQREYKEIWLHGDRISWIFDDVNCKKVEIFVMKSEDSSLKIPGEVFERMEKLKVIGLTNLSFSSMPSSLHLLNNLHSLCIHQSSIEETAIIGQLKQLEVLSFVESNLKNLPKEIGKLKNLRLLDLTDCSELEVIAPNVISNLSLLQELHLGNSFHHWDLGENNASLMELEHLSHLINLDIHVLDSNIISKDLFSKNLERYRIFIGDIWDWHDTYNETSRTLKLKFRESKDHLKPGIPMLLKRTEDLYLLEVEGVKNVVCELDNEGFPRLKNLHLHNSLDIQYVIDTMDGIFFFDPLFPKLESLFLYNLSSIKSIHHGECVARSFEKLQILKVESCVELKNLFIFSTGRGVEVTRCRNMDVEGIESSGVLMEFPQIHSICLKDLPNLRSFCSTEHLESRGIISVEESIPLFDEKIVFPKLEYLQVESIPTIERVWSGQLSATTASIQNLQILEVKNCHRLEYTFSLSMVKSLVQLRHLIVKECHSVKEIIETEALEVEEETEKMLFPKLEDIELGYLPKLERFCTGCLIECPLLRTLSIWSCPKLETFVFDCESRKFSDDEGGEVKVELEKCQSAKQPLFNEKVVFPTLTRLRIQGVCNLEKIWNNQVDAGTGSFFYDQLRSVSIDGCKKLVNIFPSQWLRRFQRLEELSIRLCNSLEEIFEGSSTVLEGSSSSSVSNFQLRDLHLSFLPKLKHIWNKNPQGMLPNFHNLHTVHVSHCNGLKNLFPFSVATDSLQQLEKLQIQHCEKLEEMAAKAELGDGERKAPPLFEFPRLISFTLKNLPEFRNFYRGEHSWECPMLKSLRVIDCPNVKVFGSKSQNIKGLLGSQHDQQKQPLFLVEKVIRSLEELSLDGKKSSTATSILWQPHLLAAAQHSYSKLKVLNLQNFGRESDCPVPFSFLQRLPNLETLAVGDCSLKKLFSYEGFVEEEQMQRVAQLKNLVLSNVDDIKREQDHPRLFSLFHHLKTLRVEWCHSLVNLASFSTSFQNLSTLEVRSCYGLPNLITSSVAKSFIQLVKLIISYCDEMIETVVQEEDGTEDDDEIVFSKLEYLELHGLGKLQSFCSANYTFKFPSLKEVIVEGCPKMLIFSLKAPNTPKLQGVCWKRNPETKKCWQGNLNATITEMLMRSKRLLVDGSCSNRDSVLWHQEPHLYSSFEVLMLKNFERKSNPLAFGLLKKLHNITTLSVEDSSLQRLFLFEGFDDEERGLILARFRILLLNRVHDMWNLSEQDHPLVPLLHNLVTLQVTYCDRLITLAPFSSTSFQNLSTLDVSWCRGLSNLITSSAAKGFVQLIKLTINGCHKMTEIVAKDQGDGTIDDGEITFHRLEHLELRHLKNLTSFSLMNYTFKFPSLKEVIVEACPKMLIFSLKAPSTPKLDGVCWQRYPEIKKCWQDNNLNATIQHLYTEMVGLDGRSNLKLSDFPQLKERWDDQLPLNLFSNLMDLVVDDCAFVSNAISYNQLQLMNELSSLHVRNCISLEKVFDLEGINPEVGQAPQLPNLKKLQLTNLPSLRQIDNMGSSLSQSIAEGTGKETAAANKILFPSLKAIILESLPNLTSTIFSGGNGIIQIPLLEEISVENCPHLKTFVSSLVREEIPILINEGQEYRLQKQDHDTVSFRNMKKLGVEWNDIMEIVYSGQFRVEYFSKLEGLSLMHFPCDLVHFPSHFLQRFINLKELSIKDASFNEIIFYEREKHNNILAQLEELKLSKLAKLMHLPDEDSLTSQSYQKLKTLRVLECSMLDILIPSSLSFQSLTTLEVSKCHGLLNLMTSSSAKYLKQVESMSITECEMIAEIMAEEENEVENEVIFRNLEVLRLECLSSLASFHLGKCTLIFPSLTILLLIECPKMKLFSEGVIFTPKLKGVLLTEEDEEGYWEDDLNSTVQNLYLEMEGAAKSKLPSASKQHKLAHETNQADRPTGASERQVPEDLQATATTETSHDVPTVAATTLENQETLVWTESQCTRIASTFQDSNEAPKDKEDPTHGSKNPMGSEAQISLWVQKDYPATKKDESSLDSVVLGVSLQAANSMSSSAYPTDKTSSQELTFNNASCSNTSAESLESYGASSKLYKSSIELIKKVQMKSPAEVAVSTDRLFLLSSLKNLKDCPFLNSQQQEIIQFYIENFSSLVTNHPFDGQKVDWTGAVKSSIEDQERKLAALDVSDEDLTVKINKLDAEKDALNKRLLEIQKEKDVIRANKKILDAEKVSEKEKLEMEMEVLLEAERHQRETENQANLINENWAKLRILFT